MRFRLTEPADEGLVGIEDWVAEARGADAADAVSDEIDARIREVAEHPLRFPVYQFEGDRGLMHEYRSANAGRFKIFYWVNEDEGSFTVTSLGKSARYANYSRDFLWLANASVCIKVDQVSEPRAPLKRTDRESVFKLYQSDTGMLVSRYPQSFARAIYLDWRQPNLGGIYENVVAQELVAHGARPYYFLDERRLEVDFLYEREGRVVPVEVKSGRKFRSHASLDRLLASPEYRVRQGYVLCRSNVEAVGKVVYLPWYMTMFLRGDEEVGGETGEGDFVMRPVIV